MVDHKLPLVSFGMPAYKGAHFKEALESIKNQTVSDFEVIVQDDASPEDLRSVFDEVCANDKRFSFDRNEEDLAPDIVKNWDITLRKACGQFFVLASDDDIYEPTFLEKLLSLAKKYPTVDIFNGRYDRFNDSGICGMVAKPAEYESQTECMYAMTCERRYPIAPNVMVRTKALRDIGGFVDLPAGTASDYLTWLKLARNGYVTSNDILLHWRYDGSSITSSKSQYWLSQKIAGMRLAQPIWIELAKSLSPQTDAESFQKSCILNLVTNGYENWMIMPLMGKATKSTYVKFLFEMLKSGKIGKRYFVRSLVKCMLSKRKWR